MTAGLKTDRLIRACQRLSMKKVQTFVCRASVKSSALEWDICAGLSGATTNFVERGASRFVGIHVTSATVRLKDLRAAKVPRLLITAVITNPTTSRTNQLPSVYLSDKKLIPF